MSLKPEKQIMLEWVDRLDTFTPNPEQVPMHVNATKLHNALCEKPDRYIDHRTGNYTMRENDGSVVTLTENGEQIPFPVLEIHVDQLVQASRLVREGSKYWPR